MRDESSLFSDVIRLAEGAFSQLADARHDVRGRVRDGAGRVARRLDLVGREEFDAAFAMLAKARLKQEEILERLDAIEAKIGLVRAPKQTAKPAAKKTKAAPSRLRSVKKSVRKKAG